MTTVEALRKFKKLIEERLETKTGWGKNDFKEEISQAYVQILEELIAPSFSDPK